MPELPEVEFARQCLERWMGERRVVRAEADPTRIFRGSERKAFEKIRGRLLTARRRGKYLLLEFEGSQGLLSHLGMTGKYVLRRSPEERFSRARFFLEDGAVVHYRDARMFGRMEPVKVEALDKLPVVQALGVDPLVDGLTTAQLREAVGKSKQPLKVALMDQSRIAGLGNIQAAEALYRAQLYPGLKPAQLSAAAWARLAKSIHQALRAALNAESVDEGEIDYVEEGGENPFLVYARAGETCRRCKKAVIESFAQGGRTTFFCPHCQPKPKRGR